MRITESSGNVFRDLGFDEVEAADLQLRSKLMIAMQQAIAALPGPQSEVAALLGVNQPRVSNLVNGRIDLFSIDMLVKMLGRLGNRIDISVRPEQGEESCSATTFVGAGAVGATTAFVTAVETTWISFLPTQPIDRVVVGDEAFATTYYPSAAVASAVQADTQYALAA